MAKTGEIVGIQYLRGLAASSVVFYHAGGTAGLPKYFGGGSAPAPWLGIFELGRLGVDLFFLISGFIIVVVSLERGSLAPAVSMSRFVERRGARILPLMWLAVLSCAVLLYLATGSVS